VETADSEKHTTLPYCNINYFSTVVTLTNTSVLLTAAVSFMVLTHLGSRAFEF